MTRCNHAHGQCTTLSASAATHRQTATVIKAAQGLTKTRLALDPGRAPIVAQIYAWRTDGKLGIKTITGRLNADPAAYPPPDPAAGWSIGGVAAMLPQPQIHRVSGDRQAPPGQARAHRPMALVISGQPPRHHRPAYLGRRPGRRRRTRHLLGRRQPVSLRAALLCAAVPVRCKICQRRMCGATKTHPGRPGAINTYYVCQYDPENPRHLAAAPDHPRTVSTREDLLLDVLRDGLSAYALAPGRAERLADLLPADAAAKQAKTDTQAAALHKRLKQIDTAQDSLIHDLHILPTDPADTAAHAMRKRIHAHFTDLHHQRETIEAQLSALAKDTGRGNDPGLLDELPELAGRLDELPERIQAELFAAFDIQVLWNAPMNQATFFATITDTSPGIITDLLTRASDDPTSAATPATSSNAVAGFTRSPICGKLDPITVLPDGASAEVAWGPAAGRSRRDRRGPVRLPPLPQ